MKENCLVIHIPHASTYIPPEYLPDYDRSRLAHELLVMTDHYCDEIFGGRYESVVMPVSRLVCDAERFRDDAEESMSRVGMGFYYTRCSDGSSLRRDDPERRREILARYYDPHHQALTEAVQKKLDRFGRCLIVDGHSFYPTALPYELDRAPDRPDFCIGTDAFHTPPELTERIAGYLCAEGYSVKFDSPFAGTLVPMAYYRRDERVTSVMIEINRRLYLRENGEKSAGFGRVRRTLQGLLAMLASQG